MFPIFVMIAGGMLLPIQTAVNSRLRSSVCSPYMSSLISFAMGTLFLIAATTILTGSPLFNFSATMGQPAWIWIGGAMGVFGLTTTILVFPHLGSIQTVILPIFGQMVAGLFIDHFGLFHAPQTPLSALRLLSSILVLAGIAGTVFAGNRVN